MKKRILLGGIPLGCDNIGDEAILECAVGILRETAPEAELTVCTASPKQTGKLLNLNTAPPYGFIREAPAEDFGDFVRNFDFYIWCGATGLSDYPAVGTKLLETAQKKNVRTIVWSVGMDSELNPVFFKIGGKKKKLLDLAGQCTFGLVNFTCLAEELLRRRIREKIRKTLNQCELVTVRDPETAEELEKCGFHEAVVGADSAILLKSLPQDKIVRKEGIRTIGFCISAQRAVSDRTGLLNLLKKFLSDGKTRIAFIPMNPKTDYALMKELSDELAEPDRIILPKGMILPGEIQSAAGACDAVISSRLHLLILSSNTGTPVTGISRGSKVDNYLANFGKKSAGTVFECDFGAIFDEVEKESTPEGRRAFEKKADTARKKLLTRLENAQKKLGEVLGK